MNTRLPPSQPDTPIAPSRSNTTVRGACPHDCPDTCALLTTVEEGRATRVQGNPAHRPTDGVLCTKVSRYTERSYHPDRILTPLKRQGPKGSGQFIPVSWDEALHDIAAHLKPIAERNPEAVLPYSYAGTMGQVQGEGMAARFFNRMGASQLNRTICAAAGSEALTYTLGGKLGMKIEHFAHAELILIWGSNPITSSVHFWRLAQEAKRRGARLVCIDPRRSETAEKCHQHLALHPGTDAALAYALMHELITHDWLDHDYIERYTLGFDRLRERALQWHPERAAEVCGISAQEIRELAQVYGHTRASAIRLNYGMQRVRGGGNAVRAIASLPALTGAWRQANGGFLLSSSSAAAQFQMLDQLALRRPDLLEVSRPLRGGRSVPRTLNMITIGDDLQRASSEAFGPRVEALIVYNSNPVAVAPDSAQVVRGFAREDLFTVVLEHFQTDTADYADYILPATTQLEHWDVHSTYGHTDLLLNRPAIAPCGQARSNAQIFRDLAVYMGYQEDCFQDSDETLCRSVVRDKSVWQELLTQGYASIPVPDAPFAQGGFLTPSGRCEFYSEQLAAQGLDGLADHLPNHELPSKDWPLAMISPPARNFLNSSFVNVASLQTMEREPILEISPVDAQPRGIASGDTVEVFNRHGRYHCKAEVSERARSGVVNGLGVWWRKLGLNGRNVNELTSQKLTDIGAAPVFYDCTVEVRRLSGSEP